MGSGSEPKVTALFTQDLKTSGFSYEMKLSKESPLECHIVLNVSLCEGLAKSYCAYKEYGTI